MDLEGIEKAILADVARKVIETMPEEKKREILEVSLSECLKDILKPWNVKDAIKDDVHKYMVEYIKQPEVQERIKVATQKSADELMDGVIRSVVISSQDAIKSSYRKFIEIKEEDK